MAKVVIYSTPFCVYCKLAKEFLRTHNVAYEEKDVATDLAAREDMIRASGQMGVPVIDVDGGIVVGFDQGRLKQLLHLEG